MKNRLRTELGDDVFTSWFARMELDAVEKGAVRLSVPTRFLRNWIQSHYSEKVLGNWQAEDTDITRLELSVRSAAIRPIAVKPKLPETPRRLATRMASISTVRNMRASVPFMSVHEALGGSPLDPRLAFETFVVGRSNTLAHAAARQVATSRRGDQLMFNPLYVHAGVGSRQDTSVAGDHLGRQRQRSQSPISDGRAVHVRLRFGAAHARQR